MTDGPSHPDIIASLKSHAAAARPVADKGLHGWWHDPESYLFPPASPESIANAELQLGFALPPLLKAIYIDIGNGGQLLGPGLLGLPGGYDTKNGQDIVSSSSEMASMLEWWEQFIVVCDRGCCMLSCIDCGDDDFSVYHWDGNAFNDSEQVDEPSDDLWQLESNTFDDWIAEELQRLQIRLESQPANVAAEPYNKPRRWWQFW